jgi:hypothetical protein
MNGFEEHAESFREVQTELGPDCPVIRWNNEDIKVIPGELKLKSKNSQGGFSIESDFQFMCLAEDFGDTLPDSNQLLTYREQRLKIESVTILAGGLQLRIAANHAGQGA